MSIFDRLLFFYVLSMVALLFCDVLGINVFFSFSTMIINMVCSCYLYIHYVKRRNSEVHYVI
ncbi:putative membrane protein [Bacillus cereus]|nr:putative membrane protein [Bacillus cereus]